jgi:hypothetical protein
MATNRNPATSDQAAATITDMQPSSPFRRMITAMAQDATMETETPFTGDDDAALKAILTAETDDEIWDADERGPLGFRDLAGCEIAILDVQVKFSRTNNADMKTVFYSPDNRQMYLLLTCTRLSVTGDEDKKINLPDIGEVFQANTSARYLVAKIWTFYVRGRIRPSDGSQLECRVKAVDLGGDQAVLQLRPIPKRSSTVTA